MFDRSACARVRAAADAHVELATLTALAALLQHALNDRFASSNTPLSGATGLSRDQNTQQLPELAAELVLIKVDVLATFGDLTPKIAQQATGTIPIVAISDDILGAGIVTSLSRPGTNTTGLTIMAPELSAKRLEVLQEMVPRMSGSWPGFWPYAEKK
jgi:ABC-type uncharacterized transport system substrate-binding protein